MNAQKSCGGSFPATNLPWRAPGVAEMSKKNASSVKRIMSELKELESNESSEYRAMPTEVCGRR